MQGVSDVHVTGSGARPAVCTQKGSTPPGGGPAGGPAHIDLDELVSSARAGEQPGEASVLSFLPELGRLVQAVNTEAGLTRQGAAAVRERLLCALAQQSRLKALVHDAPEVPGSDMIGPDISGPVFISGLPGSGASLLQNLLVEHPGVDSPTLWEMLYPAARAEDSPGRRVLIGRARAHVEASRRHVRQRGVGRLREATRPGGCHQLLANAFQSPVSSMYLRVPQYSKALEDVDLTAAYAFHREQLRAIAARIPVASLVLRAPFHAARLDDLLRVYPDAKVVRVHRDPAAVVTITAGLSTGLRRATSLRVDPLEVGRERAGQIERDLERAAKAGRRMGPDRLLDVRHGDLVSRPGATVGRVLRFIGVEPTPAVLENVEALVRSTAAPAPHAHRFHAEDFGFSADELRERFAGYVRAYEL